MTKRKHPIILAHGITRPDYLIDFIVRKLRWYDFSRVYDKFHYFKGIASFLKQHGFEVYHTSVSFAADVETRAKDLATAIQKIFHDTGHEKVHIIGHSMGGLDARHMIVNHNMADKVASLTTIGTPHLGASLADEFMESGRLNKIITTLGKVINLEGFKSLTTEACRAFNDCARDAEAANPVVYQVYASAQKRELTFLPFQKTWQIVYDHEGDNDGLVSVKSQKWEERLLAKSGAAKIIRQHDFPVPADHVNQIGWVHWTGLYQASLWNWKIWKKKRQYEKIIKQIYLKIAREVNGMGSSIQKGMATEIKL
jgi:triacylglycerol lipase